MPFSRSLGRLVVGLCAAVLLVPAASAASAASGGITSPGVGEVVRTEDVVALRAVVPGPAVGPSELTLQGPGAPQAEVVAVQASPDGGELAYDFDTSCARQVCSGRVPARNGTWTVRLEGPSRDERSFELRIPPAVPADVSAARSEDGVTLRWSLGQEPDLAGYAVQDASGALVRDGIEPADCSRGGQCSVTVPSEARAWRVRAFRASCPDCTEMLASEPSAPVAAGDEQALPDTPEAVPAPESSSPSPSAQARRPATSQSQAFTRAFGAARPQTTAPSPSPASAAAPAPEADGSYDLELGIQGPDAVLSTSRPPASRAQDAALSALGTGERVRLAVLSALLIGGAWWLRRWARRAAAE